MTHSTLNESLAEQPAIFRIDTPRRSAAVAILCGLWLVIFFASLFAPPLLDDADATHANAARHIALTGDLVTLHVNGIRYLEKAPLPYWLDALSFRIFGFNTFAAHFPQSIAVLLLTLLGFYWANRAFGNRTAFYTGLGILTSIGVFLFTRIYIPEVLLSLFLCTSLYCLLQCLDKTPVILSAAKNPRISPEAPQKHVISTEAKRSGETPVFFSPSTYAYLMWASLALAVLTKGLVAIVFLFGTAIVYLALTGDYKKWRALKPLSGIILFLAIAAPWHILAGLRNTGGMNGHGFFWFYFVNEHFLRFLGKRFPKDYNKLPSYLFWSLHIVWLFPWSLFLPVAVATYFRQWRRYALANPSEKNYYSPFVVGAILLLALGFSDLHIAIPVVICFTLFFTFIFWRGRKMFAGARPLHNLDFVDRTKLLLILYSFLVLIFFSISTNQEYYTFPAYLAILVLIAAALNRAEDTFATDKSSRRWIIFAHLAFMLIGFAVAITLAYGLWSSRHLPFIPDIGDVLAHRNVGNDTLSMSHFFDLTDASFAALRLPAVLAAITFCFGPAIAWLLRAKQRHLAATTALALTSTVFLIAAHIAFVRFAPMLSSKKVADKIQSLEASGAISRNNTVLLYGDQSYGSSIPFYLGRQVDLVNGRSTSMLFGSTFLDAPPIFLTSSGLLKVWGSGDRKLLFVPLERLDDVDQLLGNNKILLQETSGKALFTDRPLDHESQH